MKLISTHPPRARRDRRAGQDHRDDGNFYSHASCEARQPEPGVPALTATFLLTRPMRGATLYRDQYAICCSISTHTPHAGRDDYLLNYYFVFHNFYSHASCEARQPGRKTKPTKLQFLLTRLLRGATPMIPNNSVWDENFYSHASCEARRHMYA